MKLASILVLGAGLVANSASNAQTDVLADANQLELSGQFKQAAAVLKTMLQNNSLTPPERKRLEFAVDRLERIKKDFPYTKDELFADVKESVKNLTRDEFEQWVREGRFDSREIDGERRFMSSSVSNLFFRYPELESRRVKPKNPGDYERTLLQACQAIKKAALAGRTPYVLPKRFRVTMTVTANADAAPAGEIIRAWLPIPREYAHQKDFDPISASAPLKHTDGPHSSIRAMYLERPARKNRPTEFKIEYDYTAYGVWFDVKPESVRPCDPNDPALKPFVAEAPHVVFTPEIRALSEQIAGGETNPYLKAKRFYDWIGDNIKYSFAIEYSTIRNIGEYCRARGYGDCGQEALLFMTLCRLNGIPVRWQSGWNTFPGGKSIHDWTEAYFAPYGWMPVDPYRAVFAMRYVRTLAPEQKREMRDFFFGGLDQYRIAANSDHNQTLTPPKRSMRSDDVDFQRGELEWGDHNIYFDQYSFGLTVKEVKLPRAK